MTIRTTSGSHAFVLLCDFPRQREVNSTSDNATPVIDAVGEKFATVFECLESTTIAKIGTRWDSVTTSDTIDFRIETVGADGSPSGTLWGTNTNGSESPTSGSTTEVVLTRAAEVTRGDMVAIVAEIPAGSTFSGKLRRQRVQSGAGSAGFFPAFLFDQGAGWQVSQTDAHYILTGIDTGDFVIPMGRLNQLGGAFNATTSAEAGCRFKLGVPCRVRGAYIHCDYGASDFTVKLYGPGELPGGTAIAEKFVDSDYRAGSGAGEISAMIPFDSDVDLGPGEHHLSLSPSTATITIAQEDYTGSADASRQWPAGAEFFKAVESGGAWTYSRGTMPRISPWIVGFSDGNVDDTHPVMSGFVATPVGGK